MKEHLKPCPFCGSSEVDLLSADVVNERANRKARRYWVSCFFCDAKGPLSPFEGEARTEWNNRK